MAFGAHINSSVDSSGWSAHISGSSRDGGGGSPGVPTDGGGLCGGGDAPGASSKLNSPTLKRRWQRSSYVGIGWPDSRWLGLLGASSLSSSSMAVTTTL